MLNLEIVTTDIGCEEWDFTQIIFKANSQKNRITSIKQYDKENIDGHLSHKLTDVKFNNRLEQDEDLVQILSELVYIDIYTKNEINIINVTVTYDNESINLTDRTNLFIVVED